MRPPRRLRPRPSAPAVLPTLPPILCLLSWSWHLSQRARFPAHPFAAGSGRGRGYKGPGEEGTGVGESKALRALQPETARGRWPCPCARAPLFRREVRASAVPGIPTRPRGAPGLAHCGRGPGAAPPTPPSLRTLLPGRRARAGRAARAADSPPGPRASPRSLACASPRARRPGRSPPSRPRPRPHPRSGLGAPHSEDPSISRLAPCDPRTQGRRAGASSGPGPPPPPWHRGGCRSALGSCARRSRLP